MRSLSLLGNHAERPSFARSIASIFARAALRRQRNRLAELEDHLLKDIGISREEALAEAARSDWDAPSHWRG
ncbi:DUF1127 domain-containing protein [Tabrizicola sp.]|uniref:DUF1127 domain-containing protein n=1 Tax=Tabrizicola sp. TaxID=2005166 RepID=UPI003F351BC1